jgi:hypothetical protein
MTDFQKALLATALPLVVLGLVSTAGIGIGGSNTGLWPAVVWFAGAAIWLCATIAVVVLNAAGKQRYIAGMLAGLALGFVALFATCFANAALLNR